MAGEYMLIFLPALVVSVYVQEKNLNLRVADYLVSMIVIYTITWYWNRRFIWSSPKHKTNRRKLL